MRGVDIYLHMVILDLSLFRWWPRSPEAHEGPDWTFPFLIDNFNTREKNRHQKPVLLTREPPMLLL